MSQNTTTSINRSSISGQEQHEVKTKRCQDCYGLLPLAYFGPDKRQPDGYSKTCKACRSEYNSFNWTKKYGRKYKHHDPDIIRSVRLRNLQVLAQALDGKRYECIGWCPHDGLTYKLIFGDAKYATHSLAFFSMDGSIFRVFEYSGGDTSTEEIMALLKFRKIRLEFSEADIILSKRVIYLRE